MTADDDRAAVQTYVTASQREIWLEEAEDLDMSQSEYVRSMVQAGRRSFDLGTDDGSDASGSGTPAEGRSPEATPGVEGLEDRVLAILREREYAEWDELVAHLTDDLEDRLDATLESLQADDRVRYSGRHGGYTVVEDGH